MSAVAHTPEERIATVRIREGPLLEREGSMVSARGGQQPKDVPAAYSTALHGINEIYDIITDNDTSERGILHEVQAVIHRVYADLERQLYLDSQAIFKESLMRAHQPIIVNPGGQRVFINGAEISGVKDFDMGYSQPVEIPE